MKYYNRIHDGCFFRVHVERDGTKILEEVCFVKGILDTEEIKDPLLKETVEKELNKIVDRPGTGISSQSDHDVDERVRADKEADMMKNAEEAQRKLIAAGIKP